MKTTSQAIADLEHYGATVAIFGNQVWVSVPSNADLMILAVMYSATPFVAVSRYGIPVACDAIEFEHGGHVYHVQGPSRRVTAKDRELASRHEAEAA